MKSYLQDIVKHTHSLGIDLAKITGTDDNTVIMAVAADNSVIVEGKFKEVVTEFSGTFGMPNLDKLNTILNIPEYEKDAKITLIQRADADGVTIPAGIRFENTNNDFVNEYRFMTTKLINEKLKPLKFKGAKWNVDFSPGLISLQRLKFQSQANRDKTTFVAKTDKGALKFYFGDPSTHAGDFVFENNITGTISRAWQWPVGAIISILDLPGDKTYKISDDGATMITVDSGIIEYSYIIPAQTK